MNGGIILLILLVSSTAIMIAGAVLDLIPLVLIGFVVYVVIAVPIFKAFYRARKKLAEKQRNQIETLQSISTNFSYDHIRKHLVVKNRCPKNAVAFGVKDYKRRNYSDVPAKLVYTGATVGGITTGGVHLSGGYTSVADGVKSGKCVLLYSWYDGQKVQTGEVETIAVRDWNDNNYNEFKISKYVHKGKIIVVDDKAKTKKAGMLAHLNMDIKSATTLNMYEDAVIDDYPTEEKCLEIVSWICGEN